MRTREENVRLLKWMLEEKANVKTYDTKKENKELKEQINMYKTCPTCKNNTEPYCKLSKCIYEEYFPYEENLSVLKSVLEEKIKQRHFIFESPNSNYMRGDMCYKDAELNKINCEIYQIKSHIQKLDN